MRVCDQLEGQLVDRERPSSNELTVSALQQEIQQKDTELQRKVVEIQRLTNALHDQQRKDAEIQHHLTNAVRDKDVMLETLRSDISKLQITTSHSLPKKVSKQCIIIHYHYLCDVSGQ